MHDGEKSQCGSYCCIYIIIISYRKHYRIRRLGTSLPDPQAKNPPDSFVWKQKHVISFYVSSGHAAVHQNMSYIHTPKTEFVDLSTYEIE